MSKTKMRLVQSFNKLLKEKKLLEQEKAWLIKQINGFTYDGMRIAPPGPIGITWEEASTYACLTEEEKKNFKTKFDNELGIAIDNIVSDKSYIT